MFLRKRFFSAFTISFLTVALAVFSLTSCGDSDGTDSQSVSFDHGVASGDPLTERVILWTRVTPLESQETVEVAVEVATDAEFTNLVGSPVVTTTTTAERDYTVKVDFQGLSAGAVYYYRFHANGVTSPTGRAKTLPEGDVSSVKLAVFSCANYSSGYFNVYGHAKDADVDAVLHLGDYIYEYDTEGLSLENSGEVVRNLPADNDIEILTLEDYRKRYAVYRLNSRLQELHAAHPFITMWDDHEVANNSYKDGASNHDEGEGDFEVRKMAALQAYYEWMPIRQVDENSLERSYRSFSFGNLVDLHMLETRLLGRDKQLDYLHYFNPQSSPPLNVQQFSEDINSPTRSLLGKEQLSWLQSQLTMSEATWQVLGQQVVMGRMDVPVELLLSLVNPSPAVAGVVTELTQIKGRVLEGDPSVTPREQARIENPLPYNLDAWDGYPAEREAIFEAVLQENKNLVVLSGDTHNGWANNLKDLSGNHVGVEFAGPAVTSGGIEDALALEPAQAEAFAGALPVLVDDLVYSNVSDRGYMIISFTPQGAQSEWIYVDTVGGLEFSEKTSASRRLKVLPGADERKLAPVDN